MKHNAEVKKPLSEEALKKIRSSMTVPEHIRNQIGDDELHMLAEALWAWWQYMRGVKRYVASVCDKALFHPTPVKVAECPERFFLWTVYKLNEGHKIVAVGDMNKTFEADLQYWFSYFTPIRGTS